MWYSVQMNSDGYDCQSKSLSEETEVYNCSRCEMRTEDQGTGGRQDTTRSGVQSLATTTFGVVEGSRLLSE